MGQVEGLDGHSSCTMCQPEAFALQRCMLSAASKLSVLVLTSVSGSRMHLKAFS